MKFAFYLLHKNHEDYLHRSVLDSVHGKILGVLSSLLICSFIDAQTNYFKTFQLEGIPDKTIQIAESISSDSKLSPFVTRDSISGISVSGNIKLNSDSSLIRIVLVDIQYNEYLVFETYPLLTHTCTFSIENIGEETALLKNIVPLQLEIEVVDATLNLNEIQIFKKTIAEISEAQHANRLKVQEKVKIDKINETIRSSGMKWLAGETSVSLLSYQEKKQLFGGKIPNLQGFEYYVGGIFVLPGALTENSVNSGEKAASLYVSEFDWRNRHGQNWLTPIKNQGQCGSCWAFAAVGATELCVNLYFNRHLDLDLSEQELVSCSGAGNCGGGISVYALDYIIRSGIVNETCLPYQAINCPCSNKCVEPSEKIRIKSQGIYTNEESKKGAIIRRACIASITFLHHAMTLAGYKVLQEGDRIFLYNQESNDWITIQTGDPLIGQTAWLFKNSWGNWGDSGYVYVVGENAQISVYGLYDPVSSLLYKDEDIVCTDNDSDGYFTWGTGPKPVSCPECPDQQDGNDSNPCLGPMDGYGNITAIILPPNIPRDTIIAYGNSVPVLTAKGTNIKWYYDAELSNLAHTGNTYTTELTHMGQYNYYVTQSQGNCVSKPAIYTINITILQPEIHDVIGTVGKPIPPLTAIGQNIKWYTKNPCKLDDPRDHKLYATVNIGNQRWMKENLNFYTLYGSFYYNYDSLRYSKSYGRLYTWETAQNACPDNWHLPSAGEWNEMIDYLGGSPIAGGKLKESGYNHWQSPNTGATNITGFTAIPGGHYGIYPQEFYTLGTQACFRTTSDFIGILNHDSEWSSSYDHVFKEDAMSVRCVSEIIEPCAIGNTFYTGREFCGDYPYYVTQTIEGVESYPIRVYLLIVPEPPIVEDIHVCYLESSHPLQSKGENIRWYSNADLSGYLAEGNIFNTPYHTNPGIYKYYVTQTISGLESLPDTVTVTVDMPPEKPLANDVNSCAGSQPELIAIGENIKWYTQKTDSLLDVRDGLGYKTVGIGKQTWMAQNMEYKNRYAPYYDFDSILYAGIYGKLYHISRTQDLCPAGWKLPEDADWIELEYFLGIDTSVLFEEGWRGCHAGSMLKEQGMEHWNTPNDAATNDYGFTARPAGFAKHIYEDGIEFIRIRNEAFFWGYGNTPNSFPMIRRLASEEGGIFRTYATHIYTDFSTDNLYSVRCIKDTSIASSAGNAYKPDVETPGNYIYYTTQTNNLCESKASTVQLTIHPAPERPVADNVITSFGDPVPDLIAHCYNIRWYHDGELTNLADTGNTFSTGHTQPGTYIYYVTQTFLGCESLPDTVHLFILPAPPDVEDIHMCYLEEKQVLNATGENIKWYSNADLSDYLAEGNKFTTPYYSSPGIYKYYVTQTVSGLESVPDTVTVTVEMPPESPLTEDVTVCEGNLPLITAIGENIKWYEQKTDSLFDERDDLAYKTVGIGKQTWMAQNLNYTSGFPYYYDNDSASFAETYGRLYLFESARNECPNGWKLPKDADWVELEYFLGMDTAELFDEGWRGIGEGGMLKERDTAHWNAPNTLATDIYGFTALPAGYIWDKYDAGYISTQIERNAVFWVDELNDHPSYPCPMIRKLDFEEGRIYRYYTPWFTSNHGATDLYSVRCVKDTTEISALGDTYIPDVSTPGSYFFYATQTIGGCESKASAVKLTIDPTPAPPLVVDTSVCEGEVVPGLSVSGENIMWYDDTELTEPLYFGNTYNTGQTVPGTYIYYITQTYHDCESNADSIKLEIFSLPDIDLGVDTAINQNEILTLGINNPTYTCLWSTGCEESSIEIQGSTMALGDYIYWVFVTDTLLCSNTDTILISIIPPVSIPSTCFGDVMKIYPNPSGSTITIDIAGLDSEQPDIKIINQMGTVVSQQKYILKKYDLNLLSIDISSLPEGWYTMTITSNNKQFSGRLIIIR